MCGFNEEVKILTKQLDACSLDDGNFRHLLILRSLRCLIQDEYDQRTAITDAQEEFYERLFFKKYIVPQHGIIRDHEDREITTNGYTLNVQEKLASMNYKEFLGTRYWKMVTNWKKKEVGYKCQLCNSPDNLNVHHRSYKMRGRELVNNRQDLTVLCRKCHSKFHNKEV